MCVLNGVCKENIFLFTLRESLSFFFPDSDNSDNVVLLACTGGQRKIQTPSNLQERGGVSGLCVQVHEAADRAQPGVGQAGD